MDYNNILIKTNLEIKKIEKTIIFNETILNEDVSDVFMKIKFEEIISYLKHIKETKETLIIALHKLI